MLAKYYYLGGLPYRLLLCLFLDLSLLLPLEPLPLLKLLIRLLLAEVTPFEHLFQFLALVEPDLHTVNLVPCSRQSMKGLASLLTGVAAKLGTAK